MKTAAILACALAIAPAAGGISAGPALHHYAIPTPGSGAVQMGGGGDEAWFVEAEANAIARLNTDGVIEEFPLPVSGSRPAAISRESWSGGWVAFAEKGTNRIGVRYSTGEIAEFDIPTPAADPRGVASPGFVYFTEYAGNRIGILKPGYTYPMHDVPIPTPNAGPLGITWGPGLPNSYDMWFTELLANKIGRLDPYDVITEYAIPTPDSGPTAIVLSPFPDETALYFLESKANKIGKITADGIVTEYAVPTPSSGLTEIVGGSDGVWFTEKSAGKLGRLSRDGTIREFSLPQGTAPTGLAISNYTPELQQTLTSVWYLDAANDRVGRLSDNRIYAVGAGHGGGWDTEFAVTSVDGRPAQSRVGLEPVHACPMSCADPGILLETPAGETVRAFASHIAQEGVELYQVSSYLEPGVTDLPEADAWIDYGGPLFERRIPLPLVDHWSVSDALRGDGHERLGVRPVLSFPARRGADVRTDVAISALETDASGELSVRVEAFSPSEGVVASAPFEIYSGDTLFLEDALQQLGLSSFDGEIRVARESPVGLFWGAGEILDHGELTVSGPNVSLSGRPGVACCATGRKPRVVTRD